MIGRRAVWRARLDLALLWVLLRLYRKPNQHRDTLMMARDMDRDLVTMAARQRAR